MKKGSKVSKYTAEEHKARHAKAVGLSLEEFDRYLVVEREGRRWISVPRTQVKREQREARKTS
jgi:hypothetical protein